MNCLICDDDVVFAEKVKSAVVPFFEANYVPVQCMVCASAEEAQALPGLENIQLAFLDVDLVTASGIELGRTLKQKNPGSCWCTSRRIWSLRPRGTRSARSGIS